MSLTDDSIVLGTCLICECDYFGENVLTFGLYLRVGSVSGLFIGVHKGFGGFHLCVGVLGVFMLEC
jgi:hypothetical protein